MIRNFELLFGHAFRPFFLLIGIDAVAVVLAWWFYLSGGLDWPNFPPPRIRHAHEMLFGFGGGAVAGFLLTAVATWTNRPPVAGLRLILLAAAWVAARIWAFVPGSLGFTAWGLASLCFWLGLTGLMAREVWAAGNVRNYKVIPLLAAFLAAEGVFFFGSAAGTDLAETVLRAGILLFQGLISLVGGRIIPAFTRNWLTLNRPRLTVQIPAFDRFDRAVIGATVVFGIAWVLWPTAWLTGWAGLLAAGFQGLRLARWKAWLVWREPLLWVLHLGYAWIPVGFGLLGGAVLGWPHGFDAGVHALGYGAMGTLILGVAARVALGHTGRPLHAVPAMTAAFILMTLGTLCRVLAPLGSGWLGVAAGLWLAAYGLFLVTYTPILLAPRRQTG